jgi:hypothetical protein
LFIHRLIYQALEMVCGKHLANIVPGIRLPRGVALIAHQQRPRKEVRWMGDKEIRRVEEHPNAEYRSLTGAIVTGAAAGGTNAVVTQAINALKKPKKDKKKK